MKKDSIRIVLSRLQKEADSKAIIMLMELEGRTISEAAGANWGARFIAAGGKRAPRRR